MLVIGAIAALSGLILITPAIEKSTAGASPYPQISSVAPPSSVLPGSSFDIWGYNFGLELGTVELEIPQGSGNWYETTSDIDQSGSWIDEVGGKHVIRHVWVLTCTNINGPECIINSGSYTPLIYTQDTSCIDIRVTRASDSEQTTYFADKGTCYQLQVPPPTATPSLTFTITTTPSVTPDRYDCMDDVPGGTCPDADQDPALLVSRHIIIPDNTTPEVGIQNHNFHDADDDDWVKFSCNDGSRYTAEAFDLGEKADVHILGYIGSPVGPEVCDESGNQPQCILDLTAYGANTTCYLLIQPTDPYYTGWGSDYSLRVWTIPPPTSTATITSTVTATATPTHTPFEITPDVYDRYFYDQHTDPDNFPNDDHDNGYGTPISCLNDNLDALPLISWYKLGTPQVHNFHYNADYDTIAFEAKGATNYLIRTKNLGQNADTIMEVRDYNQSCNLLGIFDDYPTDDPLYDPASQDRFGSLFRFYGSEEHTYVFRIYYFNHYYGLDSQYTFEITEISGPTVTSTSTATKTNTSTTTATPTITNTPLPETPDIWDRIKADGVFDDDNTPSALTPPPATPNNRVSTDGTPHGFAYTTPTPGRHNIHVGTDVDWVSFIANNPNVVYKIETFYTPSFCWNSDTEIEVYENESETPVPTEALTGRGTTSKDKNTYTGDFSSLVYLHPALAPTPYADKYTFYVKVWGETGSPYGTGAKSCYDIKISTVLPTNTPTVTYTPSPTRTPTVTSTFFFSSTPSVTRTATASRTPTATRTPSLTPTGTWFSPTATRTPIISSTPSPTGTWFSPTPEITPFCVTDVQLTSVTVVGSDVTMVVNVEPDSVKTIFIEYREYIRGTPGNWYYLTYGTTDPSGTLVINNFPFPETGVFGFRASCIEQRCVNQYSAPSEPYTIPS